MKFKIGDKVTVVKKESSDDERYLGEEFIIAKVSDAPIVGDRRGEGIYNIGENCPHWWYEDYLKLVKRGTRKVEKHVIYLDDCFNRMGDYDSLKEAREKAKQLTKEGDACTVYKLIPVYHYEPSVKESKVKGKPSK